MRTRVSVRAHACATALLFLVAAAGCSKSKAEVENQTQPEVASVDKRDLDVTADASGLVEPIQTVEIKSKASGEVQAVHVETGQEVQRGTLLVQVEPRDVRNALAQAEADLEVAQARAQTSAANRRRVQELRKSNVATEQELEAATLDDANARAALVKARTNLELARERMNDVTIRAPMNGTIIEKAVEPGTIIASASGTFGGGTTLLKMADLSSIQVRALVDETDIGKVESGQSARITVEAYPGRQFRGRVVKVEPQAVVDQNVTMFPVLIQLENRERLLKPGMNTEVQIEIAHKTAAIVIPNDAVVAMRDAATAGAALGYSEEQMRDAMDKMRANMRAQFAGNQNAGATPGAAAETPAGGPSAAAAPNGNAQTPANGANRSFTRGEGGSFRGGMGGGRRRGTTRPGIVFVPGQNGPEPRMVMLGVNDWDYTEVVSGLKEGDKVFLMTAARLQQQQKDLQNRIRQRTGDMGGMRNTQQQSGAARTGGQAPGR